MSKGLMSEEDLSKLLMDFNVKDYESAGNSKKTAAALSPEDTANKGHPRNTADRENTANEKVSRNTADRENTAKERVSRNTADRENTANVGASRNTANYERHMNKNQKRTFLPTVLVIDDMSSVINSVHSVLKDKYKVIGVTSVNMAWDFLKVRHADLVLLDISMPDGNGISFARALKDREATCRIPIVFLTGNATQKSVIEAFTAGGTDYIIKPVNEDILLNKLGKILG